MFVPSFLSLMTMCSFDYVLPVYECLIRNGVTKAENVYSYLLECIKTFVRTTELFPDYGRYLLKVKNIDLVLEMLYRTLYEKCDLPSNHWEVAEMNHVF